MRRRTRRFVIGQYGILTVELARDLAKKKLASVIDGGDPAAERRAAREGMTVAEVCDWYLEEAKAGRLLGRNRRPIKVSSVAGDRSRIDQHITPLIGTRIVNHLKLADIERLQADIATGKSAREKRSGRGGQTAGVPASPAAPSARCAASGLLGHGPRGVTQRYVHLDAALVIAADQVAAEIARLLDGGEVLSMKEAKGKLTEKQDSLCEDHGSEGRGRRKGRLPAPRDLSSRDYRGQCSHPGLCSLAGASCSGGIR